MDAFTRKLILCGGSAALGWWLAKSAVRHARWFSYQGKVVIVTGGSRGLGLEICRRLVAQGAKVAFCSRTEEDVQAARTELEERGGQVYGTTCDVTKPDEINAFIGDVIRRFGRVDVLLNVAGIIKVGPLDSMTLDDFHEAMDINCWGPLHAILAVLPHMRRQQWGRICNVASIGGKQAVPHLLPYDASKFALVGLSTGLRTELAKDGIVVTTVNPTLMRTGSPRNAEFKGRFRQEYAWFKLGGALPIVSMSSGRAANQVLLACQRGDAEVFITNVLNPPVLAARFLPELTTEVLSLVDRLLPRIGGIRQRSKRGYESESAITRSPLTALADAAAYRNNEMRAE